MKISAREMKIGDKVKMGLKGETIIAEIAGIRYDPHAEAAVSDWPEAAGSRGGVQILFKHPKIEPISSRDPKGQKWISIPVGHLNDKGFELAE